MERSSARSSRLGLGHSINFERYSRQQSLRVEGSLLRTLETFKLPLNSTKASENVFKRGKERKGLEESSEPGFSRDKRSRTYKGIARRLPLPRSSLATVADIV